MDGRALAQRIRAQVAEEARSLGHVGFATVLVGDDPASEIYIRLKHDAATAAGIDAQDVRLPATIAEDDLLARVAELNASDDVDALLVQTPLPDHLDEERIIRTLDPLKDVDGFHPWNAGELYLGRPQLVPATPIGIMALLTEYRIELDGAHAVVIGRSDIVGKPIAHLLLQANATVTLCHTHTHDLARHTLDADVLVVAAGRPAVVTPDMVKTQSAVGDVDEGAADVAAYLTPVPGGVGPMTVACVLQNAIRCARYRRSEIAHS